MSPESTSTIHLSIPYGLAIQYDQATGTKLAVDLTERCPHYDVIFQNSTLVIPNDTARRLFDPVIEEIVTIINNVMATPAVRGCKYVILVGGFSESKLVQDRLRNAINSTVADCSVLVPNDAQMCVLKGAVLFGHNQQEICSRISKFTYYRDVAVPFRKGYHDPKSRVVFPGERQAYSDVLVPIINIGDEISADKDKTETLRPVQRRQKEMLVECYCGQREPKNPQYANDPDIRKLKTSVCLKMPKIKGGLKREVEAKFMFGGTEVRIELRDLTSGTKARGMIYLDRD